MKNKKYLPPIKSLFRERRHFLKLFLMLTIIFLIGMLLLGNEWKRLARKIQRHFSPPKEINWTLKEKIDKLTVGYPIQKMSAEIAKQDPQVAAFLVAIAKKESDWGRRTPKYKGKECYNYWGFRRRRLLMGSGGHTCFDDPADAVETVAERIEDLIAKGIDTPQEMVIWKCGRCRGPASAGAGKWIKDVRYYYNKMLE